MTSSDNSYILVDRLNRKLEVRLSYRSWKRGKWDFARCVELQMTDQGKTKREAITNLNGMVLISLIEAVETDNIDAMLKSLGFKMKKLPIPKRKYYSQKIDSFEKLNSLTFNEPILSEMSRISA
ncbi:hypothetical protein J7L05_12120 [bacterium]|nr:hypothetical protein [bacterium]